MKKIAVRVLAFLMCIYLIVPQLVVEAAGFNVNEETEISSEIEEDGEGTEADDGDEEEGDEDAEADNGDEEESGGDTETGDEDTEEGGNTEADDADAEEGDDDTETDDEDAEVEGEDTEADSEDIEEEEEDPELLEEEETLDVDLALFEDMGAGAPESAPHGSGSYQLNEVPTDYRFYTEYFVKAGSGKTITTASIARRTAIKVYAKKDEIIFFGSSVANSQIDENNQNKGSVTGKDIVITAPNGDKICKDVLLPKEKDEDNQVRPNGLGYIKNPTQEKNGPMVNSSDALDPEHYYVPLQYEVPSDGVYTFEFHSVTGINPSSAQPGDHPSPKLANSNWAQGNSSVAAWDITVLGKKNESEWEVKEGRAWADYLALTTGGGSGIKSDLNVHVLTHDGYLYKVDFKETVPYGFIFFANNTGFMSAVTDEDSSTTEHIPIYHSFYDSSNDLDYMSNENVLLHKPNETDTDTEETYKIFFNKPSSELNGVISSKNGREEIIKTAPDEQIEISELKFFGIQNNIARAGHGGYFTFKSSGEAMVTIRLDLRKAILESEGTMDTYEGSGIVEITTPAVKTEGEEVNRVYWNGKDTDGITLPAGIYGNNNVVLSTEVKRGELHFPVIDMEGLYGGLTVQRMNGEDLDSSDCYNLYYNNNPLAYGTIEGSGYNAVQEGSSFYKLSDETKSYKIANDKGPKFFNNYQTSEISVLEKDDKEYLAEKMFGKAYSSLTDKEKSIIDAEFGKELDTFHFEPVDSRYTTMKFDCKDFVGGGNQAGIDAWTYYSQGVTSTLISFALMDTEARGLVSGQIFYDVNISSTNEAPDYPLPGVKVRLINEAGEPVVHEEYIPCFDKTGHFIYDKDGKIVHEKVVLKFETVTDSTGAYRFTGVPYSLTEDTTYYVQVLLTDVQSEVMRYTCTTSDVIKQKLKTAGGASFLTGTIADDCGADGIAISQVDDVSKIYGYKYDRDDNNETVFDKNNAQSVTFSADYDGEELIREEKFKKIGYSSTVPDGHQRDYKVEKSWGTDSQDSPTHEISDGLIVELWVWNDHHIKEENELKLSRRTGALVDTQVLTSDNEWTYTWSNLDDRLQYYVLEYYTKKKPNGEIMRDDRGEERKVLIGGTMPIFGAESTFPDSGIYGFETNLGDYPETIEYPSGSGKKRIPIQTFSEGDSLIHANAITKTEKLESVDNNARQYNVTYTLSEKVINGRKTNVISLKNSQVFDDRAYYVWLDHQTKLPDLVAQTYVEGNEKKSHALTLVKDTNYSLEDGTFGVKGLSVSSVDAAQSDNSEGNATKAFRISEEGKQYAFFTATNHGNYKSGTGTRTYQVKYVVNSATKAPVSITPDATGALVLFDDHDVKVEENSGYIVYSWYMTIHVYDVEPDGVIKYTPNGKPIVLQEALEVGEKLKWTLTHDSKNENSVSYTSDDRRTSGILNNDTYRLPLYKGAESPDMGSCADLVGIAYAGSKPVSDVSKLVFEDTYESRYGAQKAKGSGEDGKAIVQGSGGVLTANLNTMRNTRINRTQDHANYVDVVYTPKKDKYNWSATSDKGNGVDVFYYKVVVFAEDNTYQYHNYDAIDASDGVVMYSYFTLKPNTLKPPFEPEDETDDAAISSGGSDITPKSSKEDPSVINLGSKSPKTGDTNNLIFWFSMVVLAMAIVAFGFSISKRNKR